MKLFYSPIGGFVHKVVVVAHEAGLQDRIETAPTWPLRPGHDITALNPLNKVPTLVLDDGTPLYGSQVVVEYMDSFNTAAPLYPPAGPERWDALRRLSLADQTFELSVQIWLARADRIQATFDWAWPKLIRAFDMMEADAAKGFSRFDIGQASTLQTLSYFQRSCGQDGGYAVFGVTEPYDWRQGRPALSAWFDEALKRPSVQWRYMKDYEGDTSAEAVTAHVREALALRSRK